MKTLRFAAAAATLGLLAAAPSFAQTNSNEQPSSQTNSNTQQGSGGMMGGSNMQNGTMQNGMMQNGMMTGMNAMDEYRMRWVYYNLDAASMRRYMALGNDERTIKGAANIALRSGLSMDYVLSRLTITGLPLSQAAIMLGVPSNVVDADIAGMGMGGMMNSMGGMNGGMGSMNNGMGGGTTGGSGTGTGTGGTGGTGTGGTGTGGAGGTGTGGTGTGTNP